MPSFPRLISLIIILFLSSCAPEKKTDPVEIAPDFRTIAVDTNMSIVNLSALASELTYIPLEVSENDIIGKVDKIVYFDQKLFVLDKHISKCLFVADTTGKFLYHKRAVEGGVRKFEAITDFAIDKKHRLLYIYDGDAGSVSCFDETDGAFRNSFQVRGGYFSGIIPTNNDGMAFYRDGITDYKDRYQGRICLFGPGPELKKSWLDHPINPFVNAGGMVSTSSFDGKRTLIARMFCDTIFSLQHDSLTATFKVDAGKIAASPILASITDKDEFMTIMGDEQTSYIADNIFETSRYLGFYYKIKHSMCLILTDKVNNRTTTIRSLTNDIDNTMLHLFEYMDDSCFVTSLTAADLQQQYHILSRDPAFRTKFKMLIALNNSITQNSNPVIILGSLK
jgi:hypothetical protein